jgi:hypothetical protein
MRVFNLIEESDQPGAPGGIVGSSPTHPTTADPPMDTARHALLFLVVLLLPGFALAGTITEYTLDDCDDQGCDGASLKIMFDDIGNDMVIVEYSVITDGTQERDGLNQIGFLGIKNWDSAELLAAPNGVSEWSDPVSAPVNANSSCSNVKSNGGKKKLCIHGYVDTTKPGEYTWKFKITGGYIVGEDDIHFGGQWANAAGPTSGKVISANLPGGAAVPEPSAALVFALGTLIVGSRLKRR